MRIEKCGVVRDIPDSLDIGDAKGVFTAAGEAEMLDGALHFAYLRWIDGAIETRWFSEFEPLQQHWPSRLVEVIQTESSHMDQTQFGIRPDGKPRHASVAGVLRHFEYRHLPVQLQAISEPVCALAIKMADTLPENADLTCGLRELLAAKDNFVRAAQ